MTRKQKKKTIIINFWGGKILKKKKKKKKNYYYKLGGGTRALHVSAPLPHQPAPIFINLRGLVFNFVKKKFLRLSLFFVADFFLGPRLL